MFAEACGLLSFTISVTCWTCPILARITLEATQGPQAGAALVQAITTGRVPMQIEALTDSYSIFSYLAAAHLRLPAEKGTYYHLAYPREKLTPSLVRSYNWIAHDCNDIGTLDD